VTGTGGTGRYAALLRLPYVAPLLGWAMLARLPLGMAPLALILLVRSGDGSYASAGAVAAAYTVAVAAGAPIAGRQVDRRGRRRVLVPRALGYAAVVCALAAIGAAGVPAVALGLVAAVAGVLLPPVGASVRSLLTALAPGELRSTAFALEASLQEVFFVGGPLLVALLAAAHPALAVLGVAVAGGAGTLLLSRLPPVRDTAPAGAGPRTRAGALASRGVRSVIALAVFLGLAFGAVEVAMPAFAEAHGSRELAGLALASFSAGSLAGGLVIGLRHGVDDRRRLLLFTVLLPPALALPLLAGSIPAVCACLFAAGLPIAPLVTGAYGLVDRIAPEGTHAETFAWIGTAISVGIAAGSAAGGWLVDAHGVRSSIGCGVAAAALGAALILLRRRSLLAERPARTAGAAA
jgi:MFS family permease